MYRPPRDGVQLLDKFLSEFNAVLESLECFPSVHVTGDFNLNLLQCENNSRVNNFLHQSFASGYFPKLIYPTRITGTSQTLIDNVFSKF